MRLEPVLATVFAILSLVAAPGCQSSGDDPTPATDPSSVTPAVAGAGNPAYLIGEFRYLADAARFAICRTGRSYPVAMEGAYRDLESAYLAAEKPEAGAPVVVSIVGEVLPRPAMEGDAEAPTVVVRRLVGVWPSMACERARADARLVDQYWRIVSLAGTPVTTAPDRREPHLILSSENDAWRATVGCNQLRGRYAVNGDELAFDPGLATRMACPPPLDAWEADLQRVLADTRRWAVHAHVLELFGADGRPLAVFEAVALP